MRNSIWSEKLNKIIQLPQRHQRDAIRVLVANNRQIINEEWNTQFGINSLYDAWTKILPMRNLYEANRAVIRKLISEKKNFTILEIGGGNGELWKNFFKPEDSGKYILIDPVENSHLTVNQLIPSNILYTSIKKQIQEVEIIPDADIIVCSLILHHIPGINSEENKMYGIESKGKGDILKKMLQSIKLTDGIIIINESDVYTDIKMQPKSHLLYHRLIDSYVRRAAKSIAFMMETEDISEELYLKLEQIILKWSLQQIETVCTADIDKRDVYELDTIHWQELFQKCGAKIISHKITDEWHLFNQYILKNNN